jgi:hypothetical protein
MCRKENTSDTTSSLWSSSSFFVTHPSTINIDDDDDAGRDPIITQDAQGTSTIALENGLATVAIDGIQC